MTSHERHHLSMFSLLLLDDDDGSCEGIHHHPSTTDLPTIQKSLFDRHRAASASELARIGCDLLTLRQHCAAIDVLRDTVGLLAACRLDKSTEGTCSEDCGAPDAYEGNGRHQVRRAEEKLRQSLTLGNISSLSGWCQEEKASIAIYDCPISIPWQYPPHPIDGSCEEIAWLEEASAITLYNLGLAHHLLALSVATNKHEGWFTIDKNIFLPEPLLAKALAFYEMSESILHILLEERPIKDPARQGHAEALVAALLNNMGQIFLEGTRTGASGRDEPRGRECFDALQHFMYEQQGAGIIVEGDDIFFVNALIASQMNGAPAA